MASISTFSTPLHGSAVRASTGRKRASFLRRIGLAIMESRQRKANAQIAEFLGRRDRRGF